MRITYLYDGQYPSTGADAWQVLNTATALSRQGAQVTLAFTKGKNDPEMTADTLLEHYDLEGEIAVAQLKSNAFGGRALAKLKHPTSALLDASIGESDLIYTRNIPALTVALAMGKPVVYDTYRPWPSQYGLMKLFFRQLFKRKNMLGAFFHSHHTLRAFADAGISEDKLRVAHNGFNPSFYGAPQPVDEARQDVGLPGETFTIGYTGRLSREKGIGALLDLAEYMDGINLLLVGGGAEEDIIQRINALPNVFLYDWQPPNRVPTFLHACDLLMLPPSATALQAGNTVLPMKLFGYFASGRPIVAPRSPDTAELLIHDENAWLISEDKVQAAADEIAFLRDNQAVRDRLAARALVQSESMTWDDRARTLLDQITLWSKGSH